jgi:predicted RNase H-like HicB family nuclease
MKKDYERYGLEIAQIPGRIKRRIMKTLKAVLSKGPDDFGAWFENIEGVCGAGATVAEAKKNLMDGLALDAKHNQDAPAWIENKAYQVVYKVDAEVS